MTTYRENRIDRLHPLVLAVQLALAGTALADPSPNELPQGGQVSYGQAVIQQQAGQMDIQQSTSRATLNWQTFNIGAQAQVNFHQPDANAVALNRVMTDNASVIQGKLTANGQVFLVNPSGVLFGKGAQVDVGGLVATTMKISDNDFQGGNYRFTRDGSTGEVVNQGIIRARNGGYVALVGTTVKNEGTLQADGGTVALAAGDGATLEFGDGRLVNINVDPATVKTLIENKQLIQAHDGRVLMTAMAASRLQGAVINNSGEVEANSLTSEGGVIRLTGADEITNTGTLDASGKTAGGKVELSAESKINQAGIVKVDSSDGGGGSIALSAHDEIDNTGTLDASGASLGGTVSLVADTTHSTDNGETPIPLVHQAGIVKADANRGKGGKIVMTGEHLQLDNDSLTSATGTMGGGEIYAGGGKQGKDSSIANAKSTRVEKSATLDASATEDGDGGTIVAWGDDASRAYGDFKAKGGSNGGNGGLVETSGHWLDVEGSRVNTQATLGKSGIWLLDPYNVEILSGGSEQNGGGVTAIGGGTWVPTGTPSRISNTLINTALGNGNSVTITTTNLGATVEFGNITLNGQIETLVSRPNLTQNLTLQADGAININRSITAATNAQLNVILSSGLNSNNKANTSANINFAAGQTIDTGGGNIVMNSGGVFNDTNGNIDIRGRIHSRGGSIDVTSNINTGSGTTATITSYANSLIDSGGGAINLITHAGNNSNNPETGNITVGGTIISNGGVINLTTNVLNGSTGTITTNNTGIIDSSLTGSVGGAIKLETHAGTGGLGNITNGGAIRSGGASIKLTTDVGLGGTGNITTNALSEINSSRVTGNGGEISLTTTAATGQANIDHSGKIYTGLNQGNGNNLLFTTNAGDAASSARITTNFGSVIDTFGGNLTMISDATGQSLQGAISLSGEIYSHGGNMTLGGGSTVGGVPGFADSTNDTSRAGITTTDTLKMNAGVTGITAGTGNISMRGLSNSNSVGGIQFGTGLSPDTRIVTSGLGSIDLRAVNNDGPGFFFSSGTVSLSTDTGAINVSGQSFRLGSSGVTATNETTLVSMASQSGNIRLTGSAPTDPNSRDINFLGTTAVSITTNGSTATSGSIDILATGAGGITFSEPSSQISTNSTHTGMGNITVNAGLGSLNLTGAINAAGNFGEATLRANDAINLGDATANSASVTTHGQAILINGDNDRNGTGALRLLNTTINSNGGTTGPATLNGVGVTGDSASSVNSGGNVILVDGLASAINFAGSLSSMSNAVNAVTIQNATTASLGGINATNGTVVLGVGGNITGAVTQTGIINANTLIGSTANTVNLAGNNTIANLGPFTSNGAFTLNNVSGMNVIGGVTTGNNGLASITTSGNLAVTSGSVSGSGVSLTATGSAISLNGLVNGNSGPVSLNAGGNISQTATGLINTTGTLTGSAGSGAILDQANTVNNLGAFNVTNGLFTFKNSGNLNVTGAVTTNNTGQASISVTAGNLSITNTGSVAGAGVLLSTITTGAISISGGVNGNGGNVVLNSVGSVTENLGGSITTATGLQLLGTGPFDLNQTGNNVATLAANTSGGAITYQDSDALTVGTVNGTAGITSNNQTVRLNAHGNLSINNNVNAGTGAVNLSTSGAGNINGGGGTIVSSNTATGVSINAFGGIGIGGAIRTNTADNTLLALVTNGIGATGNITLIEENSLRTSNTNITGGSSVGTGRTVSLTSSGANPFIIDTAIGHAGDNLILSAPVSSLVSTAPNGRATANGLTLTAGNAIGAIGAPIPTAARTINATANNGAIWLSNNGTVSGTGDLTITANATGGLVDVENTGGLLTVAAGGANSANSTVNLRNAAAGITLNGIVRGSSATDAVTISTGTIFTNNAGPNAIVANGGGRWLVYSNDPVLDVFGGLASLNLGSLNNALWGSSYPAFPSLSPTPNTGSLADYAGNRFLFNLRPMITFTGATLTKTYGEDFGTAVANSLVSKSGFYTANGAGSAFAQDTFNNAFTGTPTTTSPGSPPNALVANSPYDILVNLSGVLSTYGNNFVPVAGKLFINALPVVISGTRQYNGLTPIDGSLFSASNRVGADVLTFGGTTEAGSRNVGTYTIGAANPDGLDIAGLTLGGASAGNYTLVGASGTGSITALPVVISGTRAYDGSIFFNTNAGQPGGASFATVNVIPGETLAVVTAIGNGATVASPDAGPAQIMGNLANLRLVGTGGGADPNNYQITGGTGNIDRKVVSLSGIKSYDGTPTFTGGLNLAANTGITGESLTLNGTGPANSKNAGIASTLTSLLGLSLANGVGGLSSNYTLIGAPSTVSIIPAPLTINAVTDTKTYDSTTISRLTPTFDANQLFGTDTLNNLTQRFANNNAGNTFLLVNPGYVLNDGNNGNNYAVNLNNAPGIINKAVIIIHPQIHKTYDGNNNATINSFDASGFVGGETVNINYADAQYNNRNVGTDKPVSINGVSLTDGSNGGLAMNYTILPESIANATGDIVKAPLYFSAVTDSKFYDGNTTSKRNPYATGLVAGDSVSNLSQSFDSPQPGNRTLTVNSGFVVDDGNGGNNYDYMSPVPAPGEIFAAAYTGEFAEEIEPKYGYRYQYNASGEHPLKFNLSGYSRVINTLNIIDGGVNSSGEGSMGSGAYNVHTAACFSGNELVLNGDKIICQNKVLRQNDDKSESIQLNAPIRPRAY